MIHKKCPACGASVQDIRGTCPYCGYVYENVVANTSSQRLLEVVDKILSEQKGDTDNTYIRVYEAITNFPIPTTKSDLFEFMATLQSKEDSPYEEAYQHKLRECILKAKVLFPYDTDIAALIKTADDAIRIRRKREKKLIWIIIGLIVGGIALTALLMMLLGIQ